MTGRRGLLIIAVALIPLLRAQTGAAQTSADPLGPFLRGLADSTDTYFGRTAAVFDTTGIDSLIRIKGVAKPDTIVLHKHTRVSYSPIAGFHRATGFVAGAGMSMGFPAGTSFEMKGSYGLADKEGRYRFALSRPLLRRVREGGRSLNIEIAYARETASFAPEHTTPFPSTVSALFGGRDRQNVYERRGASAALTWSTEDRYASIGWRAARDQSMRRATRFSVWGPRNGVPEVERARAGSFREGFARIASTRLGALPVMGIEGQYASRSRWRARVAAARSVVLSRVEAHIQAEAGMSAWNGPPQDRFELGGPLAVPSLGFGDEAGNRLLLGKFELIHGMDIIRVLHIPYASFMALHPAIFAQGGSAWAVRDGRWEAPPDAAWRGAAGVSLIHIPGFPTPTTHIRLQTAWPLGRESGVARFSVTIGEWFDVAPRR